MTCAKKVVKTRLLLKDGSLYYGDNSCLTPQPYCPRAPGEGYTKCGSVCHQPHHAEVHAIIQAMQDERDVHGGHMIVYHDKVCSNCAVMMTMFNITWETAE